MHLQCQLYHTTWLPLTPVRIGALTSLVQQHSVVVSLRSGHGNLLLTFTLHQTFALAIWGY